MAVAVVGAITFGHPRRGLRDGQPTPPPPARFACARRGHENDHVYDHRYLKIYLMALESWRA